MKTFKVGFSYTEYGYKKIKAKTAKQAENILHKQLSEYGITELEDYSCNDRDYHVEILG